MVRAIRWRTMVLFHKQLRVSSTVADEVEFRNTIPGDGVLRRHRELPMLQLFGAPRFGIYGAANFGWYLIIEETGPHGC
jgi:hypothetical protein